MEINMEATIYPVCFVRETLRAELGIPEQSWYYHLGRMPGPDVHLSGYEWYSIEQYEKLKNWWLARPSVKRRLAPV